MGGAFINPHASSMSASDLTCRCMPSCVGGRVPAVRKDAHDASLFVYKLVEQLVSEPQHAAVLSGRPGCFPSLRAASEIIGRLESEGLCSTSSAQACSASSDANHQLF